jgi:hypothetical protein
VNELITWIQERLGSEATEEDAQAVFDHLRSLDKIVYDPPSGNLVLVDDDIDLKAAYIAATGSKVDVPPSER